jgi:hypothetical protein
MILMVSCGVLISISNILVPESQISETQIQVIPAWIPVLVAMACNVVFVMNMTASKYVTFSLGVDSCDFTYGYYFI